MSKRLDIATNIAILLASVTVVGVLVKDRFSRPAFTNVERAQTVPTRPEVPLAAPTPASLNALDLGPEVKTVDRATVPGEQVAAIIDNQAITIDSIEATLGNKLIPVREQQYVLRRAALDQAVERVLLEQEAKRRGTDVSELVRREIESRAATPSPDEMRARYEGNRTRWEATPKTEAIARLTSEARERSLTERRRAFIEQLRSARSVRILLDPPRASIGTTDAATKGSSQAAVTIIEFSDFECPFCAKSQETLRRLEERYQGRLRVVFKHFPLPIHRDAPRAAEAAECAGEQGRFWQMHDALFSSSSLSDTDLRRFASNIGIGGPQFSQCLDAGKYSSKWQRDKRDGERAGVTATPTFFINGRLLVGAPPFEMFNALVQEELTVADTKGQTH